MGGGVTVACALGWAQKEQGSQEKSEADTGCCCEDRFVHKTSVA
jgi:hypothetical protein